MSGIYGINRGADVQLEDIEVLLHYTPSRGSLGDETFTKLNTEEVLMTNRNPNGGSNEILGGIYTLKLPTEIFGNKGYYTILIRPVEIRTKISDVGVLSAQSDIKGIIIDPTSLDSNLISKFQNNGLIGYRVEYLNGSSDNGLSLQENTSDGGFFKEKKDDELKKPIGIQKKSNNSDRLQEIDVNYNTLIKKPIGIQKKSNNSDRLEEIDINKKPLLQKKLNNNFNATNGTNSGKINNLFRIITSNNKAEPVNQNLTNTNQKAIRYRFNDNSNLIFATVTPSSSSNVKPNVTPFIGEPNQDVILTNTFFNPLMMEIEMVEHDIETLAYGLFGGQSKSLEDGIYTIYNFNDEIYKQYNIFEIKEEFSGKPLYEVREPRVSIDFNKEFGQINDI